jgi:hypothetical protein
MGPTEEDPGSPYSFAVNVEVRFIKSAAKDALPVRITNDPNAPEIRLTEEQVLERYPWDYRSLTDKCKERYSDFKIDAKYHRIRKAIELNPNLVHVRFLDPDNPRTSQKKFFSSRIIAELDKHYVRR